MSTEGHNEIEELLPHREPFLFVDEIVRADPEKIIARHVFTEKEFFFSGHFPQYPVVPGVILIETMAQSGGAGLRNRRFGRERAFLSRLGRQGKISPSGASR